MKTVLTIVLALICGISFVVGQHLPGKGVPFLENIMPSDYQNQGKIWAIQSAPNGLIYMAADKGLLEFDGKTWKSFKGSKGITRSVLVISDSVIYTGSDLDFGIWRKNNSLGFDYESLYPFKEELQDVNEEFWWVHQLGDKIIFVSNRNVYVYSNQQLTKIKAPSRISGSYFVDGELYVVDETEGLFLFNELSLKHLANFLNVSAPEVSGIYQTRDGLVIVTKKMGLFIYDGNRLLKLDNAFSNKMKQNKAFSFTRINQGYLAFGTVLGGLYITDIEGNIVHHINKNKGLQSNTVLSLYYAPSGQLWMGLDFGASMLDLNQNHNYFLDYRGDFGTGYAGLVKDGIFYLGTNQGLYTAKWADLDNRSDFFNFKLIPGSEGQVWTLENIGNTILIGHDYGLFALEGNKLQKLSPEHGFWTIVPFKNHLLAGTYNGIFIFEKAGESWKMLKKMPLIVGSCNQIIIENDRVIWVGIPNFGIIRATLNDDLDPTDRLIFSVDQFEGINEYLSLKNDSIYVISDEATYKFNEVEQKFVFAEENDSSVSIEGLLPGPFQHESLHEDYQFSPINNGFALTYLGNNPLKGNNTLQLVLRKFEALNNDKRINAYREKSIPNKLNNIRIEYILPNEKAVVYQYRLNENEAWSSWSENNVFEFLNLHYGKYSFSVRAKVNGMVTANETLHFNIEAPYYLTQAAFLVYFIFLVVVVYLIWLWQGVLLQKQKKALEKKHEQKLSLLEKEMLLSENEELKKQLRAKTIDLANKAKVNEDKNRLLLSLKEKCISFQNDSSNAQNRWNEMQKLIDKYLNVEDNTFEIQMNELHQEFFEKLTESFPDLSNNDLRLCAYLKIGLNSKEIAELLNIQPSSSYISRSRLRKKLKLKPEEDLYTFLNAVWTNK